MDRVYEMRNTQLYTYIEQPHTYGQSSLNLAIHTELQLHDYTRTTWVYPTCMAHVINLQAFTTTGL